MMKFFMAVVVAIMLQGCGKAEAKWQAIPFGNATTQETQKTLFAYLIEDDFPVEGSLLAKVDLNNDGKPEYILHNASSPYCGSEGCSYAIFTQQSEKWVLVNGLIAHSIELSIAPDVNGNTPLLVNGNRIWQWNGKKYILTK